MNKEQQELLDESYKSYISNYENNEWTDAFCRQNLKDCGDQWDVFNKEEFINKIKTDNKFAEKWGLKIEERELTTQERKDLYDKTDYVKDIFPTDEGGWNNLFDGYYIPTKIITVITNTDKIESYD